MFGLDRDIVPGQAIASAVGKTSNRYTGGMSVSNDIYPPPLKHDPIEAIGEDLFMVRGSYPMSRLLTITRNMAIVRNEGELTLINPIRINASEEEALERLGSVRHIVRLGPFHGADDPYCVDRFNAGFWCQPGGRAYPMPPIDHELSEGSPLPFPDAELMEFKRTRQPESVLLIKRGNGTLLTCDAIQHYGDYRFNNLPTRLLMPFIGFPKTTVVGPMWLKYMTQKNDTLRPDFEQLLDLEFDSLLSAHGSFLTTNAKKGVRNAIARAFNQS